MTAAQFRRPLLFAVALWLPALLIAALELLLEPMLLPQLGPWAMRLLSIAANFAATALVCALFARRYREQAWRTLLVALLLAYGTALGLCLVLRIDVAAAGIVLLVDALLWLLAAAAGTAWAVRRH